jgi:hypothetical protein
MPHETLEIDALGWETHKQWVWNIIRCLVIGDTNDLRCGAVYLDVLFHRKERDQTPDSSAT